MSDTARLAAAIEGVGNLAIAVSGGVDSMTLATFAHRTEPDRTHVVHAVSPAVPPAATERVRALAAAEGWRLTIIDAGEFADERYRQNPVNRCYFCKLNLYSEITRVVPGRVASGTNLDDLGDYRPGLKAASEQDVVHPFVTAGFTKRDVRQLAAALGLDDLAELPAQPCLSSRVETGIFIEAADLAFVDRIETLAAQIAGGPAVVRCRITSRGVHVEVGTIGVTERARIAAMAAEECRSAERAFAGVKDYRQGAMFVHAP
ncbi:MAG TPA: adenine nucleotide alpha hydrolase [Devosia sp.]|nr:adenine nucleotide alpha hydrolase [Devosia sp.]